MRDQLIILGLLVMSVGLIKLYLTDQMLLRVAQQKTNKLVTVLAEGAAYVGVLFSLGVAVYMH